MLDHAKKICRAPRYQVQEISDRFSRPMFHINILFLPVAHLEMNPIEMVWPAIKRDVAKSNFQFKSEQLKEVACTCMQDFGPIEFKKDWLHSQEEEDRY